jgi:hypothetical protein
MPAMRPPSGAAGCRDSLVGERGYATAARLAELIAIYGMYCVARAVCYQVAAVRRYPREGTVPQGRMLHRTGQASLGTRQVPTYDEVVGGGFAP